MKTIMITDQAVISLILKAQANAEGHNADIEELRVKRRADFDATIKPLIDAHIVASQAEAEALCARAGSDHSAIWAEVYQMLGLDPEEMENVAAHADTTYLKDNGVVFLKETPTESEFGDMFADILMENGAVGPESGDSVTDDEVVALFADRQFVDKHRH